MTRAQLEAKKLHFFRSMDREPMTLAIAIQKFGIGHATFDRWKAEWKRRKAMSDGLKVALSALRDI